MLLKRCCGCGRMIPQAMGMCQECEQKKLSRYTVYNNTRRDEKTAEFYRSREWKIMRQCIINVYDNIDIYALYTRNELLHCDHVHHIVEIEEDWSKRLDPMNLIPLSQSSHSKVSALYKQSKASMKETQKQLKMMVEIHFKEAGGYEKVLSAAGLVTPPLFL